MAKDCSSIEEKLSAYLDDKLRAEEAAEVAAHLESCPECTALLNKMKNLQKMAQDTLPDFDEAVLSQLEQRINSEIDKLPPPLKKKQWQGFKIIPIWYRYAAVAASIVIIFLIGRATIRESILQMSKTNQPVQTSPAPVPMNTAPTEEKLLPEKNEPLPDKTRNATAKEEATLPLAKPSDAKSPTGGVEELKKTPPASPEMDKDVSADQSSIATPMSVNEGTTGSEAQVSESNIHLGKVAGSEGVVAGAKTDMAAIDTASSKGFSLAELADIYEKIYAEHAESGKKALYDGYSSYLATSAKHDSAGSVRKIISEYQSQLSSTGHDTHLKALYVLMRSNYDVYRFTGDTMYYKQAAVFRDSLQRYFSSQVTFEPRD